MSKLDHTLAATYSKPADGLKTINNCTIDKPVIILHKPASTSDGAWCFIRPASGCKNAQSVGYSYVLGTSTSGLDYYGGPNSVIIIPTATTITFQIYNAANDDIIYVYI